MNIKERLQDYLRSQDTAGIVAIHNEYCNQTNHMDDYVESMESFNEIFSGYEPEEIARRVFFGSDENSGDESSFNPNRDYFYFNGYANPVSFDFAEYSATLNDYTCGVICESEIINYIIENNDSLYNDDIQTILDESERIAHLTDAYTEYRKEKQNEFNSLPIFWAFSNDQLETELNKRGLTLNDTDKLYRFGNGGFYLRSDAPIIHDYMNRKDETTLTDMMLADNDFAVGAFLYELNNHEYGINWQGDYDVCGCFAPVEYGESKSYIDYLTESNLTALIPAFETAKQYHYDTTEF